MTSPALALAVALAAAGAGDVTVGGPVVQGRVVLDGSCTKAGVPAVVFDHASHRARYTCRVCHAELAFALKAGETGITAESNAGGAHCGACHDGKALRAGRPIFASCSGWRRLDPKRPCARCHTGPAGPPDRDLEALLGKLPRDRDGNVDWNGAERRGLVAPADFVEGVTRQRPRMRMDRDLEIDVKGTWLQKVTFSHRRHAVWNGCELCHPQIFPVTKRGAARYRMSELREGEYCGVCHQTVAFSVWSCGRCHGTSGVRW